ncbi:MAG: arginine--tRNA ligase [Candidatus Diapherotrites archaeon]|uniref:Arginine--tRNA ligase n=1 Tax=Candidatus Iainarchaeum sp. TaxID=3101447 RepID=A0A939CA90_9ARCH|nr:arginine--tRNA ligase [Candidatus Diapherotrites archaeon]
MPGFREEIAKVISLSLKERLKQDEVLALLESPPSAEMGDIAFPCFKLAALFKKSPAEIAKHLSQDVKLPASVEKAEAAGPYLNFFLQKESIAKQAISRILKEGASYGKLKANGKRVMVEYSAPNTNKPLHLGHLRNDSIGMAVCKLLEAAGCKVIKANLVNDRGIHICKSMLAYRLFGKGKTPARAGLKPDHFVGKYYVLYNKKAAEKPELEMQAYEMLTLWEAKDRKTIALWKKMNEWVLKGFKETYKNFGSSFDHWFFESEFYDRAKPLVELGKQKGFFSVNDEGALLARLENYGLPDKTVSRADGTSIYITNDLALTRHKFEHFMLDESIWVVGSEQNLYFKQLFKIFELLGFAWAGKCRHLSYGMVFLPSGKLKSREGIVVDADNIIAEVNCLASKEVLKRHKKIKKTELSNRARAVGLAAIKFYMLKTAAQKDLHFRPRESISFEGETGPYIQYTYARAKSILRKAKKTSLQNLLFTQLQSDEAKNLIKLLAQFPEAVQKSADSLSPHILCQLLIETAEAFNTFYHRHPVMQAESVELKKERLALVQATAQVLKNGLALLNIEAIERM